MKTRTAIIIVAVAVVVLMIAAVTVTYLVMSASQREAVATAKAEKAEQVIAEQQKIVDAAKDAQTKREQEFAVWKKAHAAQVASVDTPQKAAAELSKRGFEFHEMPAPTPDAPSASKFMIAPNNVLPLYQSLAACDEGDKLLNKCQSDLADESKKTRALTKQLTESETKADAWEQAAKGGSKMRRFWRFVAPLGCGTLAAVATRRQEAATTAVATGGAFFGCHLAVK